MEHLFINQRTFLHVIIFIYLSSGSALIQIAVILGGKIWELAYKIPMHCHKESAICNTYTLKEVNVY